MGQVTGAAGRLVIDKETSYKVQKDASSRAGWIIPFVTNTLSSEQGIIESNTILDTRNPQMPGEGQVNVTGDITVELDPLSHARLIYLTLGGYSVSGTGPYTHTIGVGSVVPSFVAETRFSDGEGYTRYSLFDGCKINQWQINVRVNSFIESTFSVIGSDETFGSSEYDNSPDSFGFAGFTSYNAILKIGGNPVASVTEATATVVNNLDENTFTVSGDHVRTSLPAGRLAVTGSFTAQFTQGMETYIDMARNFTETSLLLEFLRGSGDGSAGNEYLGISFHEIKLQRPRKEINGPQGVFLTFNFSAYVDDDCCSAVEVVVKNNIADLSI